MEVEDAVKTPRFHHQWLPDSLYLEKAFSSEETILQELRLLDHHYTWRKKIGRVNAILIKNGSVSGYADPRGRGKAMEVESRE